MNGREVFKFATRVLVSSANELLDEVGLTVDDVDVYVPHQANIRIITPRGGEAGLPGREGRRQRRPLRQHFVGLDSARARRRVSETAGCVNGRIVLMTGMGAGLTWGSGVMEWTANGVAA